MYGRQTQLPDKTNRIVDYLISIGLLYYHGFFMYTLSNCLGNRRQDLDFVSEVWMVGQRERNRQEGETIKKNVRRMKNKL